MKVKASFTLTVYAMTLMIGLVKIHNMDPTRGSQWCAFSYPLVTEWLSDLFDVAFFIVPIALQILLYSFIFSKAKQVVIILFNNIQYNYKRTDVHLKESLNDSELTSQRHSALISLTDSENVSDDQAVSVVIECCSLPPQNL